MNTTAIRAGTIGGALVAFMMTLPAPASAAQSSSAYTKQRASPAASGAIKSKATQDLGAKRLTKRRFEPSP